MVFTGTNRDHEDGSILSREHRLSEDLKFELAILATVQGFYQKLMRDSLGGDVPIPSGLDENSLRQTDRKSVV